MKTFHVLVGLAIALATAAQAKPKVKILATGGTIAGAQTSTTEVGYKSGSFSIEQLIKAVPKMDELADLSGEQLASIGSQTMNHEVWLKLAKRINEVLKDGQTDGVVITHGTDTMEETGYFLSLVVKSDKPVVLVGSMRPATAISADGPANLYNAVALATKPEARGLGPLIVINDEVHFARESQKLNTTELNTFRSPNRGRAGVMNVGNFHSFAKLGTRHTAQSEFSIDGKGVDDLPRVDIIYSYANFGPDVVDFLVKQGSKGLVLAGVGDGNSTDAVIAALSKAAKAGVAVVRSSRTGSGIVVRNVEVDDDKLGFIASMELSPQKARILLMLGLMKTSEPKKLQQYFMEY
ncbi:MAG TPA: type II asparaginase [Verrucomicrobiae bacterium]|jgi:L-asparaginase